MQTLERIDAPEIARLLDRDEFFWLDVRDPTSAQLEALAAQLGWHPLALEDAEEFDQRPKLDDYADHTLLVFYGVHAPDDALVEVHLFVSGGWVVTVRRGPCLHLVDLHPELHRAPPDTEEQVVLRILDALTDSFVALLETADARIEALEDRIIAAEGRIDLGEVVALRRLVGPARRIALTQRDAFGSVGDVIDRLPGLERGEASDELRDVADHLARNADVLDGLRDRVTAALDLYASTNGNRLNEVTERLSLVATVFLPLTFVVGFFGQNFGWLTSRIDSLTTFLIYGVGGLVVPVAIMLALFWRAGLLGRR